MFCRQRLSTSGDPGCRDPVIPDERINSAEIYSISYPTELSTRVEFISFMPLPCKQLPTLFLRCAPSFVHNIKKDTPPTPTHITHSIKFYTEKKKMTFNKEQIDMLVSAHTGTVLALNLFFIKLSSNQSLHYVARFSP